MKDGIKHMTRSEAYTEARSIYLPRNVETYQSST